MFSPTTQISNPPKTPPPLCPIIKIPVRLDNFFTLALFDTCSPACLIAAPFFDQLQVRENDFIDEIPIVFKNASGEEMKSEGRYYLTFYLQGIHKFRWPFHVIPTLSAPCILGTDFITQKKLNFYGETRCIEYPYDEEEGNTEILAYVDSPKLIENDKNEDTVVAKIGYKENDIDPFYPPEKKETEEELIINIGSHLNPQQNSEIRALVKRFRSVIALDISELGRAKRVKHEIHLTPGPPVCLRPYRIPIIKRDIAKKKIEEMLRYDIIRPSISPFSSPMVLVPKKNKEWRFCVDYRQLNKRTIPDPYPLPRLDEVLIEAAEASYFTSLDLYSGYWQIELSEDSKEKTAFTSHLGHYEFNVLSFGLRNAPSSFMRILTDVIRPALGKFATIYLDDILIWSKTFDSHQKNIEEIFKLLLKNGLRVNLAKCEFCKEVIKYLGFLLSKEGIRIDDSNIRPLLDCPAPKNVDQLKSFLGMASYFRKFVESFAHIAHHLTTLTRHDKPWKWGSDEENAFQEIKRRLTSPPLLHYPSFELPFYIDCDASSWAVGSCLGQLKMINGIETEVPIAYDSKHLSESQRKWSVIERETYAVIVALQKYYHFIFGRQIIIRSDHKPILALLNAKDPTGRRGRWAMYLQKFNSDIIYRPGKKNRNADFLSRISPPEDKDEKVATDNTSISSVAAAVNLVIAEIKEEQDKDPLCRKILDKYLQKNQKDDSGYTSTTDQNTKQNIIQDNENSEEQNEIADDAVSYYDDNSETDLSNKQEEEPEPQKFTILSNGLLATADERVVIPETLKEQVLYRYHNHKLAGHIGIKKTLIKMKKKFFWPKMTKSITNHIRSCLTCAKMKAHGGNRAPLQPIKPPKKVWSRVSADVIGPLPRSRHGMVYILNIKDVATRYEIAEALPDQTAATIARALIRVFMEYGVPEQLITDNGPCFRSDLLKELCKQLGIRQIFSSPYNSQGQGLVENSNRQIVQVMKAHVREDPENWCQYVKSAQFVNNTSPHVGMKDTSFYLMYGRDALEPGDLHEPSRYKAVTDENSIFAKQYAQALKIARENIIKSQENQKKQYDRSARPVNLKVDDYVLLKARPNQPGKWGLKWNGPYRIIEDLLNPANFKIKHIKKGHVTVAHANRLKKYYPPEKKSFSSEDVKTTQPASTNKEQTTSEVTESPQLILTQTEAELAEEYIIKSLQVVINKFFILPKEKQKLLNEHMSNLISKELKTLIDKSQSTQGELPTGSSAADFHCADPNNPEHIKWNLTIFDLHNKLRKQNEQEELNLAPNENVSEPIKQRKNRKKKNFTLINNNHGYNLRPASAIRIPQRLNT